MLSTPAGTSSRRAIQRVVISAATLMFMHGDLVVDLQLGRDVAHGRLGQAARDEQRVSQRRRR